MDTSEVPETTQERRIFVCSNRLGSLCVGGRMDGVHGDFKIDPPSHHPPPLTPVQVKRLYRNTYYYIMYTHSVRQ